MTSVGAVSLSRFVPLKRHWYAGGTALDAVTLKDAVSPLVTMRLCGWPVMVGGNSRDNTAGGLLVMLLQSFVTTTVKSDPSSDGIVGGVV